MTVVCGDGDRSWAVTAPVVVTYLYDTSVSADGVFGIDVGGDLGRGIADDHTYDGCREKRKHC